MNTVPSGSYRFAQKLHPLSLLAQLTSRRATGCLQVMNGSGCWSIYIEEGKLVYASHSVDPFDRLDRCLRRLSQQVPTLISATRVQVRVLFENGMENQSIANADYQAICWLVEQDHITPSQAGFLIEELAKEVIESFLAVREGTHEFKPTSSLDKLPKYCYLDMRSLVEQCQKQLRQTRPQEAQVRPDRTPSVSPTPPIEAEISSPRENQPLNNPTLEAASNTPPFTSKGTSKNLYTIACIDDSPTVLQAIKSFLDDKSFSVLMINDPVKALMQVIRNKPDLILLDVQMPNLDGYELCSLLRRHSAFKNTPIIMVTGKSGLIDRAKAKLVRASGYLTKPFTQSDLLKIVFKHLT